MLLAFPLEACGLSDVVADLALVADAGPNADRPHDGAQVMSAGEAGAPLGDAAQDDLEAADAGMLAAGADAGGVCLGDLAANTFRYALCACQSFDLDGFKLSTDAYDSSAGAYAAATAMLLTSHVGVNGQLSAASPVTIDGSLTVTGASGLDALTSFHVRGDLRVSGPFTYTADVDIAQNVLLASDLVGTGALHVAGNLVQAEGGARTITGQLQVDGRDLRGPVALRDPCRCADNELVDVQAFVSAAKAHNDNAAAGIPPNRLETLLADDRVELPDGKRIFLTSIGVKSISPLTDGALGSVTLSVQGRSTLVIESFISIAGELILELGAEAELDLFVGEDVSVGVVQAPAMENNRPARVRVYAGGTYFHGQVFGTANVYAPKAFMLVLNGDHYGSLFAGDILAGGELRIHYDSSVLTEGRDCDWFDLTTAP